MVEFNMTNGIIPQVLQIMDDTDKYKLEVRIWALIILNRGTMHPSLAHEFLDRVLKTEPPQFIDFLLHISNIEDLDFTVHTRLIWQEIEKQAKAGSQALYQTFLDHYNFIERILLAA